MGYEQSGESFLLCERYSNKNNHEATMLALNLYTSSLSIFFFSHLSILQGSMNPSVCFFCFVLLQSNQSVIHAMKHM